MRCALALLLAAGCGTFGGRDASLPIDAEAPADAGAAADARSALDASIVDSALPDASAPDAAPVADAFAPDASAPDAAPIDAGPTPGDCTSARLCEDFEAYAAGAPPTAPWAALINGGAVAIDETRAYSGQRSVRVTTNGMASYRRAYITLTGAPVFPLPGNVMFGRAMMWLTAAPTGSVHWTHIEAEGPVTGQTYRSVVRYGGQHDKRLMANYDTRGVRTDCWDHSRTTFPEGRWVCFEWRFDGPGDEMNLWMDGVAITDVTVVGQGEGCIAHDLMDRWPQPVYETLRLGWEHYQSTTEHELWIDDVAVSDRRVGCR